MGRSGCARLALLSLSIVLALLVGEVVVRTLLADRLPPFPERTLWRYDALLGWSHPPHQRSRVQHHEYQIEVVTNSHGLRDQEYSLERTPGKKRLLLLGDSFAWGLGVEQPEIFLELLEARHPEWEMINAGVSGYGTDQELLYYRERGRLFAPDVVLLLIHENDFRNNASSRQQGRNKPRFFLRDGELVLERNQVAAPSSGQRLERLVLRRSRLLGSLYLRARQEIWRRFGTEPSTDFPVTVELLEELGREVAEDGAQLVVASVPMPLALRSRLTDELESRGIVYRQLDAAFDDALEVEVERWRRGESRDANERPVSPFVYRADFHWNALGHRVAADAIERQLVDQGVVEAAGMPRTPANRREDP